MGASDLLNQIRAAGITVTAEGDSLRLAPRALLTDDLRTLARQHKADILAALAAPATQVALTGQPEPIGYEKGERAGIETEAGAEDADLPLQRALREFDQLLKRLAALAGYTAAEFSQPDIEAVRAGITETNAADELRDLRELIADWESRKNEVPVDDRRTCRQCANRRPGDGRCMAFSVTAGSPAVPDALLPRRCASYTPKPEDPDQRTGAQRWPDLSDE